VEQAYSTKKQQQFNKMNHFTQKYLNNIAGAGKKPKQPDPPPPPTLKPPKLGDLQALASFEYAESLDLIADGSIDGLVSQNGAYVDNERIFESIYLNDVPIKQATTVASDNLFAKYAVTGLSGVFSQAFYKDGEFQEKTVEEAVNDISGLIYLPKIINNQSINIQDGKISYSIVDGKDNIAKSIYQDLIDIPITPTNIANQSRLSSLSIINDYIRILKFGKFNYNSALEVSTFLLPDFPDKFKDEYPFVCLRLFVSIMPQTTIVDGVSYPADYGFEISDFLDLDGDIYNQTYLPFEATELNKKRFLESRRKIDLTYPTLTGGWSGSIYLFLYKKDGKILKNSVDAVIKSLKYLNIAKPKYKYNIANANCEIREGQEFQRPLSLFNKTYVDKGYGFKLTGPFGKNRPASTLIKTGKTLIDTKFDPKSQTAISGVKDDILDTGLENVVTQGEVDKINSVNKYFKQIASPKKGNLRPGTSYDYIFPVFYTVKDLAAARLGGVEVKSYSRIGKILTVTVAYAPQYVFTVSKEEEYAGYRNSVGERVMRAYTYVTSYYTAAEQITYSVDLDTGIFQQVESRTTPDGNPATLVISRYVYDRNIKSYKWKDFNLDAFKTATGTPIKNTLQWKSSLNLSEFQRAAESFYINPNQAVQLGRYDDPDDLYGKKYGLQYDNKNDFGNWPNDFYNPSLDDDYIGVIAGSLLTLIGDEGSDDNRVAAKPTNTAAGVNYSDWANSAIAYEIERPKPLVHIVNNPNVSKVVISIGVRVLKDIAHLAGYELAKTVGDPEPVDIGSIIPSLVKLKIECGYQDKEGNEIIDFTNYPRLYEIKGVADSPCTIDIGREENNSTEIIPKYSRFIVGTKNIASPIELPPAESGKVRFVRVSRVTYESFSSLIKREIYVEKITEIIDSAFSYPYSSVCGLKIDARSAPEIPARSYDARFKKVFIPSNYFPLKPNGIDKRYLTNAEFAAATTEDKTIYEGNWDGTFKFAWTDNPVWILFDILINRRYGLGNFIEPTQVNYWELYKIGRYCDAVDDNGIFVGVPAADGGYEPRYAFNGAIADKTNVFDMLKTIVSSFRGNLFYSNSEINFTNDRLKPIMSIFNNSNVKDGIFTYTNDRRDLQYNVIEVSFLDKDDLFKEKIEYVEDPDDIKNRGILRTSAQTFGVTSRAHAKRIGQHIIYSTINEDQNVQFVAGLETLLCRPGDLIAVNDELRSFKKHVGRVLNVDLGANSIYTNINLESSDFNASGITGEITVLIPTGKISTSEFYDLSQSPSKLNVGELYKNDIPMAVTLKASQTGIGDYGSTFVIDTGCSGITLLKNIKLGAPCSITLSNTKQEIYKIAAIKELNLNEYEVTAIKFDTGKFAEIESNESLNDFFNYFPSSRTGQVSEGQSNSIQNQFIYQLDYPQITNFTSGDYDAQNDFIDLYASWNPVSEANCYDVELITPKYKSIKQRISETSFTFNDQSEVGQFTLKVIARQTGVYPNPISPTAISNLKLVSYTAPIRTNAVVTAFKINKNISQ